MFRKKEKIIKISILLVTVLIAGVFTGCTGDGEPAANETNEDYVAIVNGEVISEEKYQDQIDMLKETVTMQYGVNPDEDPELLSNIENQAMQSLVHEVLIVQEGVERGIEVAETEVDDAINNIKSGFDSDEEFTKALDDNNLSIENLKEQIRKDLLVNEVIAQVYNDAGIDAENSDATQEEKDRVISEFLNELVEEADIEYNK